MQNESMDVAITEDQVEVLNQPAKRKIKWKDSLSIISLIVSFFAIYISINNTPSNNPDNLRDYVNKTSFQQYVQGWVVTDDFVVNKAWLNLDQNSGVIDLTNQPAMLLKYKNNGDFDLTDRELKNKIIAIMDALKTQYESFGMQDIKNWNDIKFTITIQNYELGAYKNGEVTLKGE